MVSIQLHDSVAAALSVQAKLQGLSLQDYLSQLAERDAAARATELSVEEMDRQLDDLSLDVPPLPADFSRADIYLDHA
jgi:hypothetical protein